MKVIVVGAGIGGLSAAIALNRAGHDVEVYESSSFLNEVGAAIHLAPNATRVLKTWDCDLETMHPSECTAVKVYTPDLKIIPIGMNREENQKEMGVDDPWLMVHRVDLHNGLRLLAEKGFQGRSVTIHLNSKVESVDAETGHVHFQDGRTVQGDLVIGADGLHSRTVQAIISNGRDKISTGQNIFRFLVPTEKAMGNPVVKKFIEKLGLNRMTVISSKHDRMIIYPCRSGALLNCAFLFASTEADDKAARETSWLNAGSVDDLLRCVDGFDEGARELCKMAEDLKLWSLMTRDPPPTYIKGKLALMGDAAHPMLPHQGQGGAQAIEDAAALGALFTGDPAPEEISDLLHIYNQVRYDHTVIVCITSRTSYDRREEKLEELRRFVPNASLEGTDSPATLTWHSYPARDVERLLALRRNSQVKVA